MNELRDVYAKSGVFQMKTGEQPARGYENHDASDDKLGYKDIEPNVSTEAIDREKSKEELERMLADRNKTETIPERESEEVQEPRK